MTVLFRAKTLSSPEKIVALALAFKINSYGVSDIRIREISELASLDPRTVRRVIESLKEKIELQVRPEGRKNTYYFIQWGLL